MALRAQGQPQLVPRSTVDIHAARVAGSARRSMRGSPPAVTNRRSWWSMVVLGALVICTVAGCTGSEGISSQAPSTAVAIAEEAHTHVDVLFARDIIEHNAQAVALSDLIIVKEGVAPQQHPPHQRGAGASPGLGVRADDRQIRSTSGHAWRSGSAGRAPPCLRHRLPPLARCRRITSHRRVFRTDDQAAPVHDLGCARPAEFWTASWGDGDSAFAHRRPAG